MFNHTSCLYASAQSLVTSTAYGHILSLPANAMLLGTFSFIALVQLVQGVAWKTL
jgi:hypothetical protein